MPASDDFRIVQTNRMVGCGACGFTYRSDDGSNPHDVRACYLRLGIPLPTPNLFLNSRATDADE